jgi:hypothetical protein
MARVPTTAGSGQLTRAMVRAAPMATMSSARSTRVVCGAGSLVPPDSFGCVIVVQPFPSQPEDEYKANRTSGLSR